MKVRLVYRNYKPLHKIYESLVTSPPSGVEYLVSDPYTRLQKLYPLSKKLRYFAASRFFIHLIERVVFVGNKKQDNADIYHYVNIIDEKPPAKPYVVDIEHAASLVSFTPDKRRMKQVRAFLENPHCYAINCLSSAAERTLKDLLGSTFKDVEHKVSVIYPALEQLDKSYESDYSHIPKSSKRLEVLFVGNQAYLKGLEEVLEAVKAINKKLSPEALRLHVVSGDAQPLVSRYDLENVKLYEPKFSKKEIFTKLFLPAHVFLMPTKEDTFGMAILDSLICGTPIIATHQFALPELITDGKDGMLIPINDPLLDRVVVPSKANMASVTEPNLDKQLAKQLEQAMTTMIKEPKLVKKLSGGGRVKFEPGQQFSIKVRNQKLLKIYEYALRSD